ncbi:hypothetical protein PFICI_00986 [Pestalotiopsis fici W106-1]|uniref:Ubiquitin-like domain-containing protein n=1 Tax=Pestalotiopsis fici (strain W106-1 / CGMCC3.15140) TaxID=1229662 RepID=W3XM84_PESFW|nr:uncharacterized protein PFICI_00986 [Pestalotiopsis fici W106-1]ETS87158.1 hypothetical protein PFICI_00986 [Pestalotiopsis fici W106-1]
MEKPKRVLPFKKRAAPRNSDTPAENKTTDDDSTSMFRKRSNKYFEDAERKAAEKAALQEKARREKNNADADNEAKEQLSRKSSKSGTNSTPRRGSKRHRMSLSDDEDDSEINSPTPSSRKSSRFSSTQSPSRSRDSIKKSKRPHSKSLGSSKPPSTQVISLDSDDDDPFTTTTTRAKDKGKEKMSPLPTNGSDVPPSAQALHHSDVEDDTPVDGSLHDPDPDDIGAAYIRSAQERAMKRRAVLEAEEARVVPAVEVMIESKLPGIPPLKVKIQINKRISMMKEAWRNYVKKRLDELPSITPAIIDSVFLTWKEMKIQEVLTLERLGITPDSQGNITPQTPKLENVYASRDKVHLEAWTPELYEKHNLEKERERKRNLGELDDEPVAEEEPEPETPTPKSIRIILKSRNYENMGLNVPLDITVGKVVQAFRKKHGLDHEKVIKLHFDGEILTEEETMDGIGVEDMDSLEVHITDP